MSKKKNTLKDLDEFLKQQAATLVSPNKLSEKIESASPEPKATTPTITERVSEPFSISSVVDNISKETNYRDQLCDIILGVAGSLKHTSPEDKMLVNTALFIKHPDRWKEEIRDFWGKHK